MTISEDFSRIFGEKPDVISQAPGRVNVIGEHVDFSDGFVLPFAIHDYTVSAIRRRDDSQIRVASLQRDGETFQTSIQELNPESAGGWERYPLGVLWATEIDQGVDLLIDGHVPLGAGLSSSAALECSVAMGINELFSCGLNLKELAKITQRAENIYVGMPCGIMDQSVSLMAQEGFALLLDCRDLSTRQIPIDLESHGLELLVIDTQVHHALVDGGYAERRGDCEEVARKFSVTALRDISLSQLLEKKEELTPQEFIRARHGISEMERVHSAVSALERNDFQNLGKIITESHRSLRDDYTVSCPELNLAVDVGLSKGALGARMIGGGFGGSAIALISAQDSVAISTAIKKAFAEADFTQPRFFTSLPSAGASVIQQAEL